jgi:hypothetical protein
MPVSNVVFAWAAVFIHTNRPMRGRVAKSMNIERTAGCVRVGYAVRSLELAVGEPLLPYGSYLDGDTASDQTST